MTSLLPVFMFAVASVITPGPNNVIVFNSVLHKGVRKTLPVYLGICVGFPILFIISGVGLGEAFHVYPILHEVLKILGITYLLMLAYKIATQADDVNIKSTIIPSSFTGGMLFQWINPKAWVIAIGGISTYTPSGAGIVEILSIASVFLFATLACMGFWLLVGHSAKYSVSSVRGMLVMNKVMGTVLALSVVPAIWEILAQLQYQA